IGILSPDIGALGPLPILALAGVCAAGTSLAFAQFDPLLAKVAPARLWGTMSGIAVAAGYFGIVVWLLLLAGPIVGEGDKQQAFQPAAMIFLILALPAILLIREHGPCRKLNSPRETIRVALQRFRHTVRNAR